jgi:hypothetical protein
MMDDEKCGAIGGMIGKENSSTQRTPACVAFSITELICSERGSNPGRPGDQASNRLNVFLYIYF